MTPAERDAMIKKLTDRMVVCYETARDRDMETTGKDSPESMAWRYSGAGVASALRILFDVDTYGYVGWQKYGTVIPKGDDHDRTNETA